jgi:hypothetical protein
MAKTIVNPRLIDYFGLNFSQDDVDFAIPRLREDIPLYLDPFLLWSSEDQHYKELHQKLLSFFEDVRLLIAQGRNVDAHALLRRCAEPREMGLGYSLGSKRGSSIGSQLIGNIVQAYNTIPKIANENVNHIEELQLIIPGIAEDRISDITASVLKDFFLEFTVKSARDLNIPTKPFVIDNIYDTLRKIWRPAGRVKLPYNPLDETPLIFAPLNLLRHLPWINYEDYYRSGYAPYVLSHNQAARKVSKHVVLEYNRQNYIAVERYIREKELLADRCKPDPLFERLVLATLRKKFLQLRELGTGTEGGNDKKYEELIFDLLSSLLYPLFSFAESRVRTASGVHIRDLIFYNDGSTDFFRDLRDRYDARQPVFELKNVKLLETEHVNQLYRYLDEEFGRFGLLVTRNPASKAVLKNTVDLHSSKRCMILCLDDSDVELMLNLLEADREPSEVIKKKYIEFTRLLPK